MLAWTIIYIIWVIVFYVYLGDNFSRLQSKLIIVGSQIVYLFVLWRLWKKLIAAAVKADEDKDIKKMMNNDN